MPSKIYIWTKSKLLEELKYSAFSERDLRRCTYAVDVDKKGFSLNNYLSPLSLEYIKPRSDQISAIADLYLSHWFDLLGSGWIRVFHGMRCRGLEGHVYNMGVEVESDPQGKWLQDRVTPANLDESQRIWRLVDENYMPIDWHLDFKSGFRWNELTWFKNIQLGQAPGADIKVPWELARMQHFPMLVWAHALTSTSARDIEHQTQRTERTRYANEFRNQILDFLATNPPRFGVNWHSTMDVAIRIVQWLVVYDLFKAFGVEFDNEFESIFIRSVYEHGKHIVDNLEYSPFFRGNHYLANIVGLLFASAYLSSSTETDRWLGFSVKEFLREVSHQFLNDGSHFEASTSYHRLSSEMVVLGMALILRLYNERKEVFPEWKCPYSTQIPFIVKINTVFPEGYFEKIYKMIEFTRDITAPNNEILQIGDNDSGRFLKLMPLFSPVSTKQASKTFLNLQHYRELAEKEIYWIENTRDHRELIWMANGLFGKNDEDDSEPSALVNSEFIRILAGGNYLLTSSKKSITRKNEDIQQKLNWKHKCESEIKFAALSSDFLSHDPKVRGLSFRKDLDLKIYPEFGLYLYKSDILFLAVRCGKHTGLGSHAHNDQLSIELSLFGVPVFVDCGTYVYTSLPNRRNLFRSTRMHNTLCIENMEQNRFSDASKKLFKLSNNAKPTVIGADLEGFKGCHEGFKSPHCRTIKIEYTRIKFTDECIAKGKKFLVFHLAPGWEPRSTGQQNELLIKKGELGFVLRASPGKWSANDSLYSPAYGVIERSVEIVLRTNTSRIDWSINLLSTGMNPNTGEQNA